MKVKQRKSIHITTTNKSIEETLFSEKNNNNHNNHTSDRINLNLNKNSGQHINLNFAIITLPQQSNSIRTHIDELKKFAIKKIKRNFSSRFMRNFRFILTFAIFLTFILNSHVILFFRVKIEFVVENFKQTLLLNQNKSIVVKYESDIKELSLREVLDMSLCIPNSERYKDFMQNTWIYIDISIIFLIPFMVMIFSCLFTFFKVKNVNENYAEYLLDKARALNRGIYTRKINKNKCILFKLFIINGYFLASVLPYFVFVVFLESGEFRFLKNFIMCLFYSNNALNVFFYGVTCGRFREELYKMNVFRRCKLKTS